MLVSSEGSRFRKKEVYKIVSLSLVRHCMKGRLKESNQVHTDPMGDARSVDAESPPNPVTYATTDDERRCVCAVRTASCVLLNIVSVCGAVGDPVQCSCVVGVFPSGLQKLNCAERTMTPIRTQYRPLI